MIVSYDTIIKQYKFYITISLNKYLPLKVECVFYLFLPQHSLQLPPVLRFITMFLPTTALNWS